MFKFHKKIIVSLAFVFLIASFSKVHAATPTLVLTPMSDGNSVQLDITGDPNSSVLFYYLKSGSGSQIAALGTLSPSGVLSTSISSSSYGIVTGTPVHISTGGLTGPVSATINWPTVISISSTSFSLSQTGLVLSVGQTSSVTATNAAGSLYISNNSNPQIANFSISGNVISATGNTVGTTVATICVVGSQSSCVNLYVTIQASGTQQLTFSQNTLAIAVGQNAPITISGGSGVYLVSNNTNTSLISATISGSTITVTANGSSGSDALTICTTDMTSCGVINITVGSASGTSLTFSQTSPNISIGQTVSVNVYGPTSSTFYISSNQNPNVVQASLSGSTLTLYGITSGSSIVTVCSSLGGCGSINLTVNYISSGGTITLSQTTLNILVGQTLSVTISGGMAPYSMINPSPSLAQGVITNNILNISGLGIGSDLMNVCSAGGGCTSLNIYVNQSSSGVTSAPTNILAILRDPVSVGSTALFSVSPSGFTNPIYSIKDSFVNSSVSNININSVGNFSWVPTTQDIGIHIITISASDSYGHTGSVSATFAVTTPTIAQAVTSAVSSSISNKFIFTLPLSVGSKGQEVSELQKRLTSEGVYSGPINGSFGPLTMAAVEKYQGLHGISAIGRVGPLTRDYLNNH